METLFLLFPVVYRRTKLTKEEIGGMSRMISRDWDGLAGLMDIPYHVREDIRFSLPTFSSRGNQVLVLFNDSQSFDRRILEKCLDELRRKDLKDLLLPMENEVFLYNAILLYYKHLSHFYCP